MMKLLIITTFNILFGLLAGFIVTLVFQNLYSGDGERLQMISTVALSSIIATTLCLWVFKKESQWLASSLVFGLIITTLPSIIRYIISQSNNLAFGGKPGLVIHNKIEFIIELCQSISVSQVLLLFAMSLFFGCITLVTPLISLAWGYIMYRYLLK